MEFAYFPGVALGQENGHQQENPRFLEFKSYVPSYQDLAMLHELLQVPLAYQEKFGKETSPWDDSFVLHDPLHMENIDRLYYVNIYTDNIYNINLEICVRQNISGQKRFVEMTISYNENDNDDFQGDGMIYMTKYPTFFLNNSITEQNKEEIRSALASDGYRVSPDETHEFMQGNPSYGNTVQHLQFLAHNAIYNNRNKLPHFKKMLPRQLSYSVDEFIEIKNGRV